MKIDQGPCGSKHALTCTCTCIIIYFIFIHVVIKEAERKIEITEFLEDLKEIGIGTEVASNVSPPVIDPVSVTEPDQMIQQDSDNDRQWVPLELCFGIPLFDPVANESVCNKVSVVSLVRN